LTPAAGVDDDDSQVVNMHMHIDRQTGWIHIIRIINNTIVT
jgi:hypothetical protein